MLPANTPPRCGLVPCERKRRRPSAPSADLGLGGDPGLLPANTPPRCGLVPCERKRRRPSTPGAPAVKKSSSASCWASLQGDILHLVSWRVLAGDNGIADYVRFRAVCPHWRSTTVCPRGRGVIDPRFHPRHWIMLPEGHRLYPGHSKLRDHVRFINLRTGAFARVRLPLFKDHFAMESVDGLLLLHRDHDMAIRILHPFTADIVDLPSLATLLSLVRGHTNALDAVFLKDRFYLHMIRSIRAACVNVNPDGVITAMLALTYEAFGLIAFASSLDQQWSLPEWKTEQVPKFFTLQGKLYLIAKTTRFFVIDPPLVDGYKKEGSSPTLSSLQPPKLIANCPPVYRPVHLVECDSEILLVGRTDESFFHVVIYRLADVTMGRFIPLKSIGENSLFVSPHGALCVSSNVHPTIVGDTIVDLHPSARYHNEPYKLGQYHMKSDTWSTATDGDLLRGPIPSPYTLVHHIYTCCIRSFWNKGQIYCPAAYHNKWGRKQKWRVGG